uniref:Uncharacterized protein n=1 Tax=Mola mola TaxID=94237 RepID=A0A3Q4BA49_MOLML
NSAATSPPPGHLHVHCDSCYSRCCRAQVEVSLCCALVSCRLHCGALFHLCKEEDHMLLCPNVRVPCLNVEYGCRLQLPRSSQAAHLRVCPASVVCCSMEWIRWPNDDTSPHSNTALQENVIKENEGHGEALDLAMALGDQSDLYSRLKMKPLYPELMEAEEEDMMEEEEEETATGGLVNSVAKTYNMAEMMFSMERGGCAVAQANKDSPKKNPKSSEKLKTPKQEGKVKDHKDKDGVAAAKTQPPPNTSKTGLAPWQDGVLERLGQELSPQEYNMYVMHHGRMLVKFGQIPACTPREKDFVYGSLEPIPVQTLCSFKVPDSYHYRRRAHLYDTLSRVQSEPRSVDTSDLGVKEEDWFSDEAATTLLGYAEKEVMGHKVSQIFKTASITMHQMTTLAEVLVDRPLKLHLQLQSERVNSRHNRASCVFTFICGHTFHRREFATHIRNVHSDIQTSLSGWFEQRCPLAYLGCTYSQRRFQPSTQKATVSYKCAGRFHSAFDRSGRAGRAGGGEDALSSLPYEVLCHMASFLDSLSLSQLALVSQLMRQVCSSLLQERGMVTLRWERKTCSHGGAKWRVWEFSHLFSTVDSWHMADVPPVSAHLKVCPYYETHQRREPVPLPSMKEKQEGSKEQLGLLKHLTGSRWKQ